MKWSDVGEAEAAKVKASTGIDIGGHVHAFDSSAAKHIHKQHGDPAREEPRGQVAVTADDLRRLPAHIAGADEIERGGTTKQGRETIRYYHDEQGTTVVVEEVRTGRKELVPVSMRIHKGKFREPQK